MKLLNLKYLYALIFILCASSGMKSNAQNIIEIDPLFEYPVAPEELESIVDKSEYLLQHFWDQFDFKSTTPLNQIALNDAFSVYITPMRFASEKASVQSLDNLINKISNNPTYLVQFIKAAEEALYGPRAEIWSDEIYLRFLDAGIKNKKVSQSRKEKYQKRADLLRANTVGNPPRRFEFTDNNDRKQNYFPMSTPTIILFGDPEDTDWRLARLKYDTDTSITQALEKGKLNIIYIVMRDDIDWKNLVSNYSKYWKTGVVENVYDIFDIRAIPSAYLIDNEGKLIMKNAAPGQAFSKALELVN